MKKFILLGLLLTPFAANATGRVGPAMDESENPVMADDSAPYQLAETLPGDSTTAVSASYVKGAYNEAIAAVNKVYADKQDQLIGLESENILAPNVFETSLFMRELGDKGTMSDFHLVTSAAVAAGIYSQRVTAVDSWGSTHTVDLGLKTVTQ